MHVASSSYSQSKIRMSSRSRSLSSTSSTNSLPGVIKLPGMESQKGGEFIHNTQCIYRHGGVLSMSYTV